ncbi:SGNH/GDSL hydrolase family protein [Winogradskyella aurantiaca]|uniref:SGNH/GDSL hydrolase family protein n=1 Tax=Winogradskyella aurantiaca TaxID=2219558 RepID=UPI000E1E0DB8|nr:SGNH/GDSL hydrolase family protein [Winogradskyella aurantiaca]
MKTLKYIGLSLLVLAFLSCDDDVNNFRLPQQEVFPPLEAGTADFSTYVALGNSLTSGFTDNALFRASQFNSYPNIMAEKMALVGGGAFNQPLTNDNFGGLAAGGVRIPGFDPRLVFGGAGPVPLESVIGPVTVTTDIVLNNPIGPFNNLGIPGAASFHLLAPGYGNIANLPDAANPYAVRVTGNAPNATMVELALAQNPTFFSLWIGNNDVLGFATSGGVRPITPQPVFDQALGATVALMAGATSGGVIANIPDVTTIPFLTTIPFAPLDPSNPAFGPQIPALNAQFAALNAAYAFLGVPERSVVFSETEASPVVIFDAALPNISVELAQVLIGGGLDPQTAGLLAQQYGQSRQANANDLLTLPSSAVIATLNEARFAELVGLGVDPQTAGQLSVNGVTFPLENQWVLTGGENGEIDMANMAVTNFNATIESLASQNGLALVDANALLVELNTTGIMFDDYMLTSDLVFGGVFSLDGVHLTARGYALAANKFLEAIDEKYGSNFIESGNGAKAGDYPTNYSPTLQ